MSPTHKEIQLYAYELWNSWMSDIRNGYRSGPAPDADYFWLSAETALVNLYKNE